MHGWGMNRSDIFKNTYFLRDLGFNLCYFDFRALGESGGKLVVDSFVEDVRKGGKSVEEVFKEVFSYAW